MTEHGKEFGTGTFNSHCLFNNTKQSFGSLLKTLKINRIRRNLLFITLFILI
ncbi:hypothetical protein HMPREF0765_3312 [Sphingobacterium spiritivorum ATCC 33300]|uniref:Uncharacterized protein n=1 Tax=Sphingobacterium spiritivorum ATCC 33300 TaxID=525372 RepID=C2G156_SPHSI|nr:hypothetical protein HMPREF0765_3312 [Sphingobacterium spiritivorum ATCC 33300]